MPPRETLDRILQNCIKDVLRARDLRGTRKQPVTRRVRLQTVCAFIRCVACVSDSKLRTLVGEALPDSGVWHAVLFALLDRTPAMSGGRVPGACEGDCSASAQASPRPTLVLDDGVSPASVHVDDSFHGGKDLGTYLRRRALRNVPQEPPLALCKRATD